MIQYNLCVSAPFSFVKASDFLAAVRLHCELLPEYMPTKWGWTEPRTPFDPDNIEQLMFKNGEVDSVFWRCSGKNRATGAWMPNRFGGHGSIKLDVYKSNLQENLLTYLKVASQRFDADISCLDSCAEQYKEIGMVNDYAPTASSIYLRRIRDWLPDMPWAVVFGPAYVRMFGKERLLSTPAYKIEDIGPEMVFIQLTPNMEDIHKKYDEVMQARAIAKQHLGEECFFKPELAYDYREHPEKAGKVFRVPMFELKPD